MLQHRLSFFFYAASQAYSNKNIIVPEKKKKSIFQDIKSTNLFSIIFQGIQEADRKSDGFYIRDGLIIIPKRSTIADGIII